MNTRMAGSLLINAGGAFLNAPWSRPKHRVARTMTACLAVVRSRPCDGAVPRKGMGSASQGRCVLAMLVAVLASGMSEAQERGGARKAGAAQSLGVEEILSQGLDQVLEKPELVPPKPSEPSGKPGRDDAPAQALPLRESSGRAVLQSIAFEMELVGPWIADRHDPGDVAQRQAAIVDRLRSLVDLLEQSKGRGGSQGRSESPGLVPESSRDPQPSAEGAPGGRGPEPAPTPGGAPASGDAGETPQPASAARLAVEYWGHLPRRAQESLQQIASEAFLPKYRAQIENYYRLLAEESDRLRGGETPP